MTYVTDDAILNKLFKNLVNFTYGVSGFILMFIILFQINGLRYEMENLPNSALCYLAYRPMQFLVLYS